MEAAELFKEALELELKDFVPPRVFLDTDLEPGERWPQELIKKLCRSACLAAVCVPIYFSPQKEWCAIEWASMEALGAHRLPGYDYRTIIPMLCRNDPPLPRVFAAPDGIQYEDFSGNGTARPLARTLKTNDGRARITRVVRRVKRIAFDLVAAGKACSPADFVPPNISPFAREPERPVKRAEYSGYGPSTTPPGGDT